MDEETIKQVAYRIWEERGRPDGLDFEHWLHARDEIDVSSGVAPSGVPNQEGPVNDELPVSSPSTVNNE
jgi:hypothetical protein